MWMHQQAFAKQHFPLLCQQRPVNSHKGTFGTVAIIGGSTGMSGAVILAAQAALKLGAGKVKIGFAQPSLPLPVLERQPEIMLYTATDLLAQHDISAWAIGCGLGTEPAALQLLKLALHTIDSNQPVVWDADALNLFAAHPTLQDAIQPHHIITPHPSEAARILQTDTATVQSNRAAACHALHQRLGCISVLKGHQTLVLGPESSLYTNPSGNAGLATAGTGDVLTGMVVSLLSQGFAPSQAAPAAVWLHGAAADNLALQQVGPIGMVASELVDAARWLRNRLAYPNND